MVTQRKKFDQVKGDSQIALNKAHQCCIHRNREEKKKRFYKEAGFKEDKTLK